MSAGIYSVKQKSLPITVRTALGGISDIDYREEDMYHLKKQA